MRPWGLRGELLIEVLSDTPGRFRPGSALLLNGVAYTVAGSAPHKGGLRLKLKGVDSPEAAAALRSALIQVPESVAPPLPEGTYYHFQIIGLKAVTTRGAEIGEIVEVLSAPGNDVYVARRGDAEIAIPAIVDVVKRVDLERGVLVVEPVPGLL